jgi:hypothetical protein
VFILVVKYRLSNVYRPKTCTTNYTNITSTHSAYPHNIKS